MYGIVYVHKDNAESLRDEIKDVIYNDYIANDYSDDMPSDEFINNFGEKYNICIPNDIFFDEEELMKKMMDFMDDFELY